MGVKLKSVPLDIVDKILEEFFIKDGQILPSGAVRKSTLLACKNDYIFLRAPKLEHEPYNLSKVQIQVLRENMPTFATLLVYFSAVDLLSRVMRKRLPERNESRRFFLWSATRWFEKTRKEGEALWKLRCAVSHQYHLDYNLRLIQHGTNSSIQYSKIEKVYIINLNGLFGDIRHSIDNAYRAIIRLNPRTKQRYANFIYKYGFFYIR